MRILVADDLPSARKTLRKLLARLGEQDCVEASNGREAIELLKTHPCDLIITDWQMPQMDGLELLKALRADPEHRHIPVFMATSENDRDRVVEAVKAGLDGYLCKPFSITELQGCLIRVKERSHDATI